LAQEKTKKKTDCSKETRSVGAVRLCRSRGGGKNIGTSKQKGAGVAWEYWRERKKTTAEHKGHLDWNRRSARTRQERSAIAGGANEQMGVPGNKAKASRLKGVRPKGENGVYQARRFKLRGEKGGAGNTTGGGGGEWSRGQVWGKNKKETKESYQKGASLSNWLLMRRRKGGGCKDI